MKLFDTEYKGDLKTHAKSHQRTNFKLKNQTLTGLHAKENEQHSSPSVAQCCFGHSQGQPIHHK